MEDEPVVVVDGPAASDVKATAFVQPDGRGGLIAIGNFGVVNYTVTLSGSFLKGKTYG